MAWLQQAIKQITDNQNNKLKQKLNALCSNSKWKYIGRLDLIENLSDIKLSNTKWEAFSFDLKFATGIWKGDIADTIIKNHKSDIVDQNRKGSSLLGLQP